MKKKIDVYKDCPGCGEHTYVVSIFGDVCANCPYKASTPPQEAQE